MSTWVHTHLPRLRSGETPDILSVKVPGQKIEYVSWISLRDAEFKVHEKGRQRCIREGVRNVHAWVIGQEVERLENHWPVYDFPPASWRKVVYDPWKGGTFVDSETLSPVTSAAWVILSGKNVWYSED
jgi:hypothetical protein